MRKSFLPLFVSLLQDSFEILGRLGVMSNIIGDSLIRRLRKERGLTIAELADEICSEEHLARIERGKRAPSRWVFKQIMEKLGENPNKYYTDIVTLEDKRIVSLKDKLKSLLLDRTENSNEKAEALIGRLAKEEAFAEKEGKQFLAMSRATLAYNRENYKDLYDFALEAILVTKTNFNVDKIDTYFLSNDEIWACNQLAVALFFTESVERSTETLYKLKTVIERGCVDSDEIVHTFIALLCNLSKNLGMLGRYDEAIDIATISIDWCERHRESKYHPLIMFNKACGLLYNNELEEGKELLCKVYCLFKGYDRKDELSFARKYVEENFKINISNIIF